MLLGPHIKQGQRLHFHCIEILPARNRSLVHVNPSPHQIRFGEMENCSSRSFCHILLWGSRSTLARKAVFFTALRATTCWQMRELATQESYDKKRRRAEPSPKTASSQNFSLHFHMHASTINLSINSSSGQGAIPYRRYSPRAVWHDPV